MRTTQEDKQKLIGDEQEFLIDLLVTGRVTYKALIVPGGKVSKHAVLQHSLPAGMGEDGQYGVKGVEQDACDDSLSRKANLAPMG